MQTEIRNPERPESTQVQSQFIHLSVQEYLAMCGLIQESPERVREVVTRLCRSEQYNMSLLFLYGMVFDEDVGQIGNLPVFRSSIQKEEIQNALEELITVSITCV